MKISYCLTLAVLGLSYVEQGYPGTLSIAPNNDEKRYDSHSVRFISSEQLSPGLVSEMDGVDRLSSRNICMEIISYFASAFGMRGPYREAAGFPGMVSNSTFLDFSIRSMRMDALIIRVFSE